HDIARVFLGNGGLKPFGRRDVGLAGGIAVLQSRQAAAAKREGKLGADPQGRVVVGNAGIVENRFRKHEGPAGGPRRTVRPRAGAWRLRWSAWLQCAGGCVRIPSTGRAQRRLSKAGAKSALSLIGWL